MVIWVPNLFYLEPPKEIPGLLLDEFTYQGRVKIAKKYIDSTFQQEAHPWTMDFINQFSKNYFSQLGRIYFLIDLLDPFSLHMFSRKPQKNPPQIPNFMKYRTKQIVLTKKKIKDKQTSKLVLIVQKISKILDFVFRENIS